MTSSVIEDFDSFYRAHFGDTVAMTYGFTADLPEAQEIAQEAFCRAWSRWRQLSSFDNPAAWVRRVAVNLAHSRWRRMRVAAAYLVRERAEPISELEPDHVAVVAALRKLPRAQREALVLHYIVDLPLSEVAEHLEVPIGTVKSWLHRGRAELARDLRIDVQDAVRAPGSGEVVETVKRRRRVRGTAAAAIVAALVIGVLAAMRMVGPAPRPDPIESPTPAPSPTVVDPIRAIDWTRAGIEFRVTSPACPSGTVTFQPVEGAARIVDRYPEAIFDPVKIGLGEVDGDGRIDAAVPMFCRPSPDSDDAAEQLFVISRTATGALVTTAVAGARRNVALHTWISEGVVYIDSLPRESVGDRRIVGEVEGWRWDRGTLRPVDTSAAYPRISVLNLSEISSRLPCRPTPGELRPQFGADLRARAGDRQFSLAPNERNQIYAELGRAGRPYLVLELGCGTASPEETRSVLLLDRVGGQWKAVDVLPNLYLQAIRGNVLHVAASAHGAQDPTGYAWDGSRLRQIT